GEALRKRVDVRRVAHAPNLGARAATVKHGAPRAARRSSPRQTDTRAGSLESRPYTASRIWTRDLV
ncbi:MAG: hypothetical protein OXF07_12560, partial [Rhodobacter sp.]|nr:hypothetical protein [Rhodobacter sp.]